MPSKRSRGVAGVDPAFDHALRRLAAALGSTIVGMRPITTLPGASSARATCRLRLADGREVKGRRLRSAGDAERVDLLLRAWATRHIPVPLGRLDDVLIEPWIPGRSLAALEPTASRTKACGRVLGFLHTRESGRAGPEARAERVRDVIRRLADMETLSRRDGRRLVALAERHAPGMCQTGIIHGDFCPENIVVAHRRAVRVIDCETVAVDALDYDLARTAYRWPLAGDAETKFLDGYRVARDPSEFLRHRPFWMACALADAALFRATARTPNARVPLNRLLALLEPEPARRRSAIRVQA